MVHNPSSRRALRYGLNPHQAGAQLISRDASSPLAILSGNPGFINLLDALRGWKLVRELQRRFGQPSAASFKHVNPAGVALGSNVLPEEFMASHFLGDLAISPLATAYLRARHGDRIATYGDFVALSDNVDIETAETLRRFVSDGVIAPGYTPEALTLLRRKRDGRYLVLAIDPAFEPDETESRTEFGLTMVQDTDNSDVPDLGTAKVVSKNRELTDDKRNDLLLAMIVARHTQSNAVVVVMDGQTIGIGAGQQSRISATRLACAKADAYRLLGHPKVFHLSFAPNIGRIERMNLVDMFLRFDGLSGTERRILAEKLPSGFDPLTPAEREAWLRGRHSLCLASDAFIPFRDNVDRAAGSSVTHIVQTGGSLRDAEVTAAADEHGIVMLHSGARYFLH